MALHHISGPLFNEGQSRSLGKGELVYGTGDQADHVYGVVRGVVKLYALNDLGKQVVFSFRTAGSIFGELALVDGSARDHFAEIRERAELRSLPVNAFSAVMKSCPEVGLGLARHYGKQLKQMSRMLTDHFFRSSSVRVAATLLMLAREHGVSDGPAVVVDLRLSQEELGGLAGVSRERVNGCLSYFRELGLLEIRSRKLRFADLEEFARLSRPGNGPGNGSREHPLHGVISDRGCCCPPRRRISFLETALPPNPLERRPAGRSRESSESE